MSRNIAVSELKQFLYRKTYDLSRPLFVVCFGDVHKDSPEHAASDWRKFCEYYRVFKKTNQVLFIGMGDYTDALSRRERVAMANPDIHESTIENMEDVQQKLVDEFYNDISFMEGNLLGLVEGNHYWQFSDGTTTTMRLCNKLGCKYLAGGLYGKIQVCDDKDHVRHTIDIYAAHGDGNTITIGGSITKIERFAGSVKANIYILGHDHQHITADIPLVEVGLTRDGLSCRTAEYKRCAIRSGSFLRVYQNNSKSYAIGKMYKPSGLGNGQVEINFARNSNDRYFTLSPQLRSY
jgi:hypothetical protein